MKKVYENLKAIRQAKGFTQEALADKIGLTTGNYIRLEKGQTKLTIERLYELAEIFDIPATAILIYSDNIAQRTDAEYYKGLLERCDNVTQKLQFSLEAAKAQIVLMEKSQDEQVKDLKQKLRDQKRTIEERERELAHKDEMIKAQSELIEGLKLALASTKEALEAIRQTKG